MLGWCGFQTYQERFIPPVWKQLKTETTKTGNRAFLNHLLEPSNVGYEEVNIFLRKNMVPNITTQNFGFGYTTAYEISHHGVMPFTVLSVDLTTMVHIDISQQK